MLQHLKKHIAAITVAGVVLGGGAVAYAADQPARPKVGRAPAAGAARKMAGAGGMLARVVHGDLVVRAKSGFENVTYDRGSVTSAGNGSITLHRPDGKD